ncbi:transposase [bacterium]|nr:transposase [bacterium]
MSCAGQSSCHHPCKSIRIPLAANRRIFTPIARSSYKWDREYNYRSAVERVNSRLDVSFGFERHFIRGRRKMHMRLNLAFIVMTVMALGHVKAGRKEEIRSLIKSPDQTIKKKAA